eukprot:scaffold17169_cov18-Prasinocladus_malaysianus.AAC.1
MFGWYGTVYFLSSSSFGTNCQSCIPIRIHVRARLRMIRYDSVPYRYGTILTVRYDIPWRLAHYWSSMVRTSSVPVTYRTRL